MRRPPSLKNTSTVNPDRWIRIAGRSLEAAAIDQNQAGSVSRRPLGPRAWLTSSMSRGPVNQLDRVLGGELLGRERERAGGDEEALVAERVMDGAQELLEHRRADHAALVVLALDDGEQPSVRRSRRSAPSSPEPPTCSTS